MPSTSCLIGLGANLGDRQQALDRAVALLTDHPQMHVVAKSAWRETPAVGGPAGQPPFLNGAVVVATELSPQAVWAALQQIETDLGRQRGQRWGPRTIDLDLLLYDRLVLSTPSLVIPHPRMAWRRFVLEPAAEIAGSMVHPTTGWTVARLREHLDTALPYVAVTGSIGAGKTRLAEQLARQTSARLVAEAVDARRLAAFYADPPSQAWQTEVRFLEERTRLLAADAPQWSDRRRLAVSDFWFDQSAAFARVWLPAEQWPAFRRRFDELRQQVARPKLIVLLEAGPEELHRRIRRRGYTYEQVLTPGQLGRIQEAILAEATQPDQGPLIRLTWEKGTGPICAKHPAGRGGKLDLSPFPRALGEVLAAVEAMK